MKKNITINLFGQLYNIDEDAYELLEKYQKNIRSYFSRREGGEEVAVWLSFLPNSKNKAWRPSR